MVQSAGELAVTDSCEITAQKNQVALEEPVSCTGVSETWSSSGISLTSTPSRMTTNSVRERAASSLGFLADLISAAVAPCISESDWIEPFSFSCSHPPLTLIAHLHCYRSVAINRLRSCILSVPANVHAYGLKARS